MTKFIKKSLIVTALLITIITYAGKKKGDYILKIATGNGKMVSFIIDALQDSSFSIYDQNHDLVYAGEAAVNKFETSKTISLEGLPVGIYLLEVSEDGRTIKHEIEVTNNLKAVRMDKSVNMSPSLRR
ncbi:hypothetical protein [Flavobacterium sp. WG21]|uniref:hypothetical protein n=1 Tax=Flavobacterium sp. WG21 TaxID=1229487 RepID=UPI0003625B21|nr:hypothetical protein [Flavobacterium sp. WG21]